MPKRLAHCLNESSNVAHIIQLLSTERPTAIYPTSSSSCSSHARSWLLFVSELHSQQQLCSTMQPPGHIFLLPTSCGGPSEQQQLLDARES